MKDATAWRDYFFGELPAAERAAMERQLAGSAELRDSLRQLRQTVTTLRMLPDEAPPRRIALALDTALDKTAAPSPWRRWIFGAGPVFASAGLSALAVFWVMSGRPAPQRAAAVATGPPVASAPAATTDPAAVRALVREAVAQSEARGAEKTKQLLAEAEKRHGLERQQLLLNVQDTLNYWQKKMNVIQVASAEMSGAR